MDSTDGPRVWTGTGLSCFELTVRTYARDYERSFKFGIFRSAAAVKFVLFFPLYRSDTHMLVQGLQPKTMYEFAVRLHVDQLSSPWSPVVYHTTLPEGKELGEDHAVLKRKLSETNGLENCLLILSCL